jgi:transcriptional regulator with XRE-family HTH domain
MPGKRIVIKLTQDEQHLWETYVSQGHKNAREITRARIFLLSNDGRKVQDIAKVLGVSQTTISHVRKKYYNPSCDLLEIHELLRSNAGWKPIAPGEEEAHGRENYRDILSV